MTGRSRGRPPKTTSDVVLVWAIRNAKDRGLSVEKACENYRELHGASVGTVAQIKRRYERFQREYPDLKVDVDTEPSNPRLRAMARAFGLSPRKVRVRQSLGATLLTTERVRPSPKAK